MINLPQQFSDRMQKRLGEAYPAFLSSYEIPPYKGLRVNTLKISTEAFQAISPFALEPIPWAENGFYITEEKPGADVYHFAGLFYVQEPSAMCAAPMLEASPGERVLDLCAAPGGKTTQLAASMRGEGVLVANEIDFGRAKILAQNIERMGIKNAVVTSESPDRLARQFPSYFDKILVDAPCSGEGMFKKEPNAIPEWSEANVMRCAARQREILDCAAEMLAGGGKLVYSTCTFAEEEDEWQIGDFLRRHPEFELLDSKKLLPHEAKGEGHFCACLHKTKDERGTVKPYPVRSNSAAEKSFKVFAEDFFEMPALCHSERREESFTHPGDKILRFTQNDIGTPDRIFHFTQNDITTLADGRMYLVPAGTPNIGVQIVRLGVELGEWDGKLFKPAHALAMAFGTHAKRKVTLSREDAKRYLRGETVEADLKNGWCVVCVEAFPLGVGKAVNGTIKNHLPKGLRMIK